MDAAAHAACELHKLLQHSMGTGPLRVVLYFWPRDEATQDGHKAAFEVLLFAISQVDLRFRTRHREKPFSTASKVLRPGVTDEQWRSEMEATKHLRSCCAGRDFIWPLKQEMDKADTDPQKQLRIFKRAYHAFGRIQPTSLSVEHWHTFQRSVARGDKGRPTTFASQANAFTHENVSRRWEDATGDDLTSTTDRLRAAYRTASQPLPKFKRPGQLGNPVFPFAHEQRALDPSIPWADIKLRWDAKSDAEKELCRAMQKTAKAAKAPTQAQQPASPDVANNHDGAGGRGPWCQGDAFPTTEEALKEVIQPFKTKLAGVWAAVVLPWAGWGSWVSAWAVGGGHEFSVTR